MYNNIHSTYSVESTELPFNTRNSYMETKEYLREYY